MASFLRGSLCWVSQAHQGIADECSDGGKEEAQRDVDAIDIGKRDQQEQRLG